ncbi:class I SAM-dependent methyltransferase [Roseiconus nitratireducens]|uniref:Class I SAM-dependent methyltransferase n=1 Tax=Roseiconus nitratireducens TaxID=2605748 RepID=A0A5M6D798_9BACT|nr:class I SAM-dependent methyltransferase [Roseiconus nitratireducens]KAA5542536.1 class I SAM-dependent methyltransferase [Roseiconus nitratireducens]
MATDCLICRSNSDSFGHATVLGRYDVEYFRCRDCHFIQTETPYWLDAAYRETIAATDVGLIARHERVARITDRLLRFAFPTAACSVDYRGGYGMFTRMMRDRGHHCFHFDAHCQNLFARGFEAELADGGFDLLCALEVFEHLPDPHQEIQRLDRLAEHWLVSTEVVPDPAPPPGRWWYYHLEGGQHVSLWSGRALQAIACHYGRTLISVGDLHLFCQGSVNAGWVRHVLRDRSSRWLDPFRKRRSLLVDDAKQAVASIKQAA